MKLPSIRRLVITVASLALLMPWRAAAAQNQRIASPNSQSAQTEKQQSSVTASDPLAPLLAQAQDALDRKDFIAAIPLLEKIAAAKPSDGLPHFELGFAYSALKKSQEAIREYRQAVLLNRDLAPAHLNLGLELLDSSDPAAAAESFRRAAQLLPGETRPVYLLGEALERSGKRSEAIEQYRSAAALAPKDNAILFALGRALLAQGQSSAAESTFRQLLAVAPDSPPAQLGLAESLLAQQKTSDAVDLLRAYLQNMPEDVHARFELAVALQDLNRLDDALQELDRLDQAAPPPESLKLRGSIYLQQKKWREADASLQKALAASPSDAQLHLWLGQAKMELHDYSAAEKELQRSLELVPGNSDALRQLVGVYYLSGQYERTLSTLDLLAARETPAALDWFFRALSCDKLARKPQAAEAYAKFLELDRGQRPDQEFQAQARLKLLRRELGQRPGK